MKYAKRLLMMIAAISGQLVTTSSFAVNDMEGGPAVRQLNFQPPVTAIASDIYQLHTLMMVICVVIFLAVFGLLPVMFVGTYLVIMMISC